MSDERPVFPVLDAHVFALIVECGCCGGPIELDFDALDLDNGIVEPSEAFPECPHCQAICDATLVRLHASIATVHV